MEFTELSLSQAIQKALKRYDYTNTTPIQEVVIPLVLEGKDVRARAQTGSGKSASFVLPILELLTQ